jgi:hypothetical protein
VVAKAQVYFRRIADRAWKARLRPVLLAVLHFDILAFALRHTTRPDMRVGREALDAVGLDAAVAVLTYECPWASRPLEGKGKKRVGS